MPPNAPTAERFLGREYRNGWSLKTSWPPALNGANCGNSGTLCSFERATTACLGAATNNTVAVRVTDQMCVWLDIGSIRYAEASAGKSCKLGMSCALQLCKLI